MNTGDSVVQNSIVTPTETKEGTVYTLKASYAWATAQNAGAASKPNLCTSGTPQLLKVRVTVSWGPNADANNVQDSVIINYPPAGVQTLGFIALQMQGATNAYDTQSPSAPWSAGCRRPPSPSAAPSPRSSCTHSYGCVFAQVTPGSYTVTVSGAQLNTPPGTSYGSAGANPFVANAAGSVTNHVWSEPTSEANTVASCGTGTTAAPVSVGAVTRLQLTQGSCYPAFDQSTSFSLSYPSTSTLEDGVACPGANQITCVATGQNGSGAVATWSNGATDRTRRLPAGVTRIAALSCAGSTACIGVGYGTGGAVVVHGTTGASLTLTADTLPAVANLNVANALVQPDLLPLRQPVCDHRHHQHRGGGRAVRLHWFDGGRRHLDGRGVARQPDLALEPGLPTHGQWLCGHCHHHHDAHGRLRAGGGRHLDGLTPLATGPTSFSVTALGQLNCTSAVLTACVATGTGKINSGASGPIVVSGLATAGGLAVAVPWSADLLTNTTVTSLGQVICPTSLKCLVAGYGTSTVGPTTGALFLWGAPGGALSSGLRPSATSIGQVACPSATTCVALGTTTGSAPAIYTGTINVGADGWASDTVPAATATSLSQIVCSSATNCVVTGTGTNGSGQPQGYLLTSTDGTSWSSAGLPSSDYMLYFDDVDCTSGGASATCSAVGATPTTP